MDASTTAVVLVEFQDHRRGKTAQKPIANQRSRRDCRRKTLTQPQPPGQPEDRSGQQRDMRA